MNLLLTSIGKRVQLIKYLKKSFKVIGADADNMNAGRYFTDAFYKIHKACDEEYIEDLLSICRDEKIDVLIPLYEGEFDKLSLYRKLFQKQNVTLLLSCQEILEVSKDKQKTYEFFKNSNINVPKVYKDEEVNAIINTNNCYELPLIIKPKDGMGSSDVFKINNIKELIFFKDYVQNPIIQKFIKGEEYTVDVLTDLNGKPIYVVPRKRIEVRSGEVVKSASIHDEAIIKDTLDVLKELNKLRDKDGLALQGPLTIQFIKTDDEKLFLLEINPRFGGGVPLSFESGADYAAAILDMLNNKEISYHRDFDQITMIRYEEAVYKKEISH